MYVMIRFSNAWKITRISTYQTPLIESWHVTQRKKLLSTIFQVFSFMFFNKTTCSHSFSEMTKEMQISFLQQNLNLIN